MFIACVSEAAMCGCMSLLFIHRPQISGLRWNNLEWLSKGDTTDLQGCLLSHPQYTDLFCPPLECASVLLCVFACLWMSVLFICMHGNNLVFWETIHNNNSWKWKTLEMNEITCRQILFGLWQKPGTSAVRPKRATNGAINGWEMELSASVNVSWGLLVKVNKQ